MQKEPYSFPTGIIPERLKKFFNYGSKQKPAKFVLVGPIGTTSLKEVKISPEELSEYFKKKKEKETIEDI